MCNAVLLNGNLSCSGFCRSVFSIAAVKKQLYTFAGRNVRCAFAASQKLPLLIPIHIKRSYSCNKYMITYLKGSERMNRYKTFGVCSRAINFEVEDGVIKHVDFEGGCSGNTQGVSRLVEGMSVDEAIRRLRGISCNGRPTSCPDQLARALEEYRSR